MLVILQNEMLIRGWNYLLSMTDDFTSIVVIVTSITLSIFSRNSILISLSLGQILYLSYIVQAGGDFMLGRHFAVLVFLSVGQMIISLSHNQKLEYISKNILLSCLTACLVFLGAIVGYPFLSSIDYESRRPFVGIPRFKFAYCRRKGALLLDFWFIFT